MVPVWGKHLSHLILILLPLKAQDIFAFLKILPVTQPLHERAGILGTVNFRNHTRCGGVPRSECICSLSIIHFRPASSSLALVNPHRNAMSVQLPKEPCSFLSGIPYLEHISLAPSLPIFQGEILVSGVAT